MPAALIIVWLSVPAIIGAFCRRWVGSHILSRRRFVKRWLWTLGAYYAGVIVAFGLAYLLRRATWQESSMLQFGCILIMANPLVCGLIVIQAYIIKDTRWNACPHCAYPIGQNERCTECGAKVGVAR